MLLPNMFTPQVAVMRRFRLRWASSYCRRIFEARITYRDDSILLSIGMRPFELMLQLLAKRNDPFSGGRTYYCHPA